MRILTIKPLCPPVVETISGDLKSMQAVVGGYIQAIYPFEDAVAIVCHEEGKLIGLPLNRALRHPETDEIYDVIAGTFFLCAAPPDAEDFSGLSDAQIAAYTAKFLRPEIYMGGEDND
ncbi:DUF3846 domain-containing protein [Oscillospiraceae bacterium OttesenSCG-928-F05]|nr:DUF3846 domain-containing protein [Oscillospiraceae bacterium OttesenSCG-928-F05]